MSTSYIPAKPTSDALARRSTPGWTHTDSDIWHPKTGFHPTNHPKSVARTATVWPLLLSQLDVARPIPPTTNFRPPLSRLNERHEGMRAHLFYAFALANVHVDRVAVVDPTLLPYSSRSGVLFFPPALLARRVSLSLHRRVFRSSWPSSDAHTLPFSFHYKVCTNLSYSDLIKFCLLSDSLSPADLSRRHGDYFVTSIPCLIPQLDK